MSGEISEAPASTIAPFPLHFTKQTLSGGKSNSCESPVTFLICYTYCSVLTVREKCGPLFWVEPTGLCGAPLQEARQTSAPHTLSTPLKLPPRSTLSLTTLSIMGFPHCSNLLPRKKRKGGGRRKIEFGEEVKVLFNSRETHKSSVKHLSEEMIGAGSTLGEFSCPLPHSR